MAPSLEEEVVFQVRQETDDEQYLSDKLNALRDLGFKIDNRRVKVAKRRYELITQYNSQEDSVEEELRAMIHERVRGEEERLEKNPKVLPDSFKVKTRKDGGTYCVDCGSRKTRKVSIIYSEIRKVGIGVLKKFREECVQLLPKVWWNKTRGTLLRT